MHAMHRNLIALAVAGLFASPAAFAAPGAVASAAAHANAATLVTPPATKPVVPSLRLPAQTNTRASDAVSNKTTVKETLGTKPAAAASQKTGAQAATAAPGNGNWWKDADLNGDGKLSKTEAAANAGLSARFDSIDGNKDGFVTDPEYRKFFTSSASQGETHAAANSAVVSRDVWAKLDANADSKISLTEAKADANITGAFTDMDVNADGFISQDEYRAFAQLKK